MPSTTFTRGVLGFAFDEELLDLAVGFEVDGEDEGGAVGECDAVGAEGHAAAEFGVAYGDGLDGAEGARLDL